MFLDGIAYSQLLLFGEYAAAYGYPAIGIPLPGTIRVSLFNGKKDRILARGIPAHLAEKIQNFNCVQIMEKTPYSRLYGKEIHADSSIPCGMGCGFTAAFCVALARTIIDSTDRQTAWEAAYELEKQLRGASSGIETGIALGGGIKAFHTRPGQLPAVTEFSVSSFFLVCGAIPREGNGQELTDHIKKEREKGNIKMLQSIQELGKTAEKAIDLFVDSSCGKESFYSVFAGLINNAQEHLSGLGAGCRELDTIIKIGRDAGAPAGKISGTGRGGAFFFFVEDEKQAAAVQAAVARYIAQLPGQCFVRSLYFETGNPAPVFLNIN